MEAASLIIGVVSKLTKVATVTYENWKQSKDLKEDLEYIREEMQMVNALIKDYSEADNDQGKRLEKEWIRGVQDLAYDIEDCIDVFERSLGSSGHRAAALPILSALPLVNMVDPRTQFATEIRKFKVRIEETAKRGNMWAPFNANSNGNAPPAPVSPEQHAPEADLEGIDQPKMELLELLEEATTGQQASMQLKVISIVGCRGLGKTALARAVYETDGFDQKFPCRAWVVASKYNWNDAASWELFLRDILGDVYPEGGDTTTSDAAQLKEYLTTHLKDKRYLIVIDDVRRVKHWTTMKSAFPNNDKSSRIIVTTSVKSVATTCSSGSYLYGMKALGKEQSRNLFWKKVFGNKTAPSPEQDSGSKGIMDKCDGLPLALVSIAQAMLSRPEITGTVCEQVCADLGNLLVAKEAEDGLEEIKRVLQHSYYSLPRQDLKNCLLSVSIFPRNYQINRKRLVRRWLAEGFVHTEEGVNKEKTADKLFEELIDQHIIQPVDISNNAKVKTCQVHGIMLDFIVNKSASEKFITLIHSGKSLDGNGATARRLCLHDTDAERVMETIHDISRIRSLAIFKHVGPKRLDFRRCGLLRVLDLEDCKELKDSVLNSICKLLQLRYLSLRGTDISKIPSKISRLQLLDTLDLRGTKVALLPMEVLTLPRLAHLFGRFQLPRELNRAKRKLQESFSKKSELQTLAGFEMNNHRGFEQIILRMSKLRKVKVCSESTPRKELTDLLVSSLQERFEGTDSLKFLSIDFGGISIDFMDSLKAPCLLYSIKLRGKLTKLPGFIKSLESLKELSLFSTRLDGSVLQALQDLPCLVCLKLVDEAFEGHFDVRRDGFRSIHRLCFKARDKLPQMHIAEGAMQCLSRLQLLCKNVDGVNVAEIAHLRDLKEVTLHTSVNDNTKIAWKNAASLHNNRPKISYHTEKIDDPTANGHASS